MTPQGYYSNVFRSFFSKNLVRMITWNLDSATTGKQRSRGCIPHIADLEAR